MVQSHLALIPLALLAFACSSPANDSTSPTSPGAGGTSHGGTPGIGGAASGGSLGNGAAAGAGNAASVGGAAASTGGTGGVATSGGGSSIGGAAPNMSIGGASGADSMDEPLGAVAYKQTFDALSPGLWKKNLDGSKVKAHATNAQVTTGCGKDGSNCLRIVYRDASGLHKQPASDPVFTGSGSSIDWTPSDADHTNTATDVVQENIDIDGSTTGTSTATATAVPSKAYTLSYDVYFEPGFDFAKGGKLPGLAAAAFDSGCTEDGNTKRQGSNWSERLMWRANGRLQLYSYDQSRPSGSCGIETTIDDLPGDPQFELPGTIPSDDKFRLQPGTWYSVRLSVRVNDNASVTYLVDTSGKPILDADGYKQPIGGNGAVSLAIESADGATKRHLVFSNVALRDECDGPCPSTAPDSKETWVNALFFSTFFGGNETKRTTCVDSVQSTLEIVVPGPMPSYAGLTQSVFDTLCASQMNAAIYPKLTWNPQTPSAARFDNFVVNEGYTGGGF
jgi:hypothetical protein